MLVGVYRGREGKGKVILRMGQLCEFFVESGTWESAQLTRNVLRYVQILAWFFVYVTRGVEA